MFSNLSKALQASRDALGTIQTTIKDQGMDSLGSLARSSTATQLPATSFFDDGLSDDGFRDQALIPPAEELIRFSEDKGPSDEPQPRSSLDSSARSSSIIPPGQSGGAGRSGGTVFANQSQPALSSMTPEQVLSMDVNEMGQRLARLRKFEAKFQDLARVYKSLQRKLQQIETVISANAPVQKISSSADLEAFDAYLKSLREKQDISSAEIGRLSRQVSEIKEVQELESTTKQDMFVALQSKLLQREEEINRLKHALQRQSNTPPASPLPDSNTLSAAFSPSHDSLNTNESSINLKLKIRDLTSQLKRAQDERDAAKEKFQQLSESVAAREESQKSLNDEARAAADAETSQKPAEESANEQSLREMLARAENLRETADKEVAHMRDRVSELESSINARQTDLDKANGTLQTLEQRLVDQTTEKTSWQERFEALQREKPLPDATDDTSPTQANLSKAERKKVVKERDRLATQVTDLEQRLNEQTGKFTNLEARNGDLLQQLAQQQELAKGRDDLQLQIAELQRELEDYRTRLRKAEENADKVKAADALTESTQIRDLETQLAESLGELERIQAELATAQTQGDTHNEKARVLEQRIADRESRIEQLEAELARSRDDLSAAREQLSSMEIASEKAAVEAREALAASTAELQALREVLHQSDLRVKDLESIAEQRQKDLAASVAELQSLRDAQHQSSLRVKDLESAASDRQEHHERELASATTELQSLREAQTQSSLRVNDLESAASESQKDHDRLQNLMKAMREKLQTRIGELEGQVTTLTGEIESLRAKPRENGDVGVQLSALQADLLEKERKIRDLEVELQTRQETVTAVEVTTPTTPNEVGGSGKSGAKGKKGKNKAANNNSGHNSNANLTANNEITQLKTAAKTAQAKIEELQSKLNESENLVADLQRAVKTADEKAEGSLRDAEAKIAECERLQSEMEALRTQLADAAAGASKSATESEARVGELTDLVRDLDGQLQTLQTEKQTLEDAARSTASASRNEAEQRIAMLENQLSVLQGQYDKVQEEFAENVKATIDAQSEARDLQSQLDMLQGQYDKVQDDFADKVKETIDAQAETKDLQSQLDMLQAQYDKVQDDFGDKVRELMAAEAKESTLRTQLVEAREAYRAASSSATELQSLLSSASEKDAQLQQLREEKESLERQLADAASVSETAAALENRVTQLTEEIHTLTETQKRLQQEKAEIEQRLHTSEENQAFAKQAVHERDAAVNDLGSEIASLRMQLKEEEEKKAKSIQLLRQSKARILKLEAESRGKDEALAGVHDEIRALTEQRDSEIREKDMQLANVTRQIEDMQTRLRRQHEGAAELERQRIEFTAEKMQIRARLEELESAEARVRAERDAAWEELEMRNAELDSARSLLEAREAQLSGEIGRWTGVEERMANMEHELETSKRLFQSKSAENDSLRIRVSELEAQVYEASQASGKVEGDLDALRRDAREAKRDLVEKGKEIDRLKREISDAQTEAATISAQLERLKAEGEQRAAERDALQTQMKEWDMREVDWKLKEKELATKVEQLEAEREKLKKQTDLSLLNRDKLLEDMRVREGQLKNLNKTLKDEVRKLSRTASSSALGLTPTTPGAGLQSPPPISRPSSSGSLHTPRHSHHGSITSIASDDSVGSRRESLHTSRPSNLGNSHNAGGGMGASGFFPPARGTSISAFGSAAAAQSPQSTPAQDLPEPNQEYLKAVLLKFLEARDKRAQLLQVLAMLLHFSPDELKRVQKNM